jgi:hypothetical protein
MVQISYKGIVFFIAITKLQRFYTMTVAVFIDLMALFTYYDGCPMNPIYCVCDTVDGNSCPPGF